MSSHSIAINFLFIWSIGPSSSLVHFKNNPLYLYKKDCPVVDSFNINSTAELGFKKFSHSFEVLYSYFFIHFCSACVMMPVSNIPRYVFWCFLNLVILILLLFLFSHFSLSAWYIFQCQIPFLYSDCIFLLFLSGSQFFFIFCKYVDIIYVHELIYLFWWFYKCVASYTIHYYHIIIFFFLLFMSFHTSNILVVIT